MSDSLPPSKSIVDATHDARQQALTKWASATLNSPVEISVASADASFRRYFRARMNGSAGVQSYIIMDAPPDKEDVGPYIKIASHLVAAGINAPRVLAENLAEGFLLLSDLGDRTYLTELLRDAALASALYGDAIGALVTMQVGCTQAASSLPVYDAALLTREMELFPDWLMTRHLGKSMTSDVRKDFDAACAVLIESALAQPRVFVHRDYHSRNLMRIESPTNPGVLDFQDAVAGPVTYDLVSLLRDCYIAWPASQIENWVNDFRQRAQQQGIDVGQSQAQFTRWFDLMGVQRHLKASGIFARLWHRDGKRGYLADIPRTLNYIRAVLPRYPELASLARIVAEIAL